MRNYLPDFIIVSLVSLIIASFAVFIASSIPTSLDTHYHFNAAQRLAQGDGLVENHVWVYIGQPPVEASDIPVLETPSHLYWMPLTSLVSGVSIALFGDLLPPYQAAQVPMMLMLAATLVMTYFLGIYLGGNRRHGIVALLLVGSGGLYLSNWGEVDTFANYALIGSLCLVALGKGALTSRWYWFALAGVFSALAHLTRSDGLLFIIVGVMTVAYALVFGFKDGTGRVSLLKALGLFTALIVPYLLVMLPWFIRMYGIVGAPLPLGGLDSVWLSTYDELFNYPAGVSPSDLFADGFGTFLSTRWEGLSGTVLRLIVLEGAIIVFPFMLIGLWRKRGAYVFPMFWFAVGLHVAMAFVFPLPGVRGSLLHGAVALVPWWMVLGTVGLDVTVEWIAKRLKHWNPPRAKVLFSAILAIVVVSFSIAALGTDNDIKARIIAYQVVDDLLPDEARVMSIDPPFTYYYTGRGGTVTPNAEIDTLLEVANIYATDYLIIRDVSYDDEGELDASLQKKLFPIIENTPDFLTPIDIPEDIIEATLNSSTLPREELEEALQGVRIYAFNR